MRCVFPILVGIAVLGCKDKEAARPAEQPVAAPKGSGAAAPSAPAPSAPPTPTLPSAQQAGSGFDGETEDKEWATTTEAAIHATAPDLTDIECRQRQCRATLTASSEQELVAKAEQIQGEDSLRATGARSVLLTAPTEVGGKRSMRLFVRFDR